MSDSHDVLIVHPQLATLKNLTNTLVQSGFSIRATDSVLEALAMIETSPPPCAIVSLKLGDNSGLDILDRIKTAHHDARVLIVTMHGDIPTAVAAMKRGATDYLLEPLDTEDVLASLLPEGLDHRPAEPDKIKADYILLVLKQSSGNVSETARRLGMHRRTVQRIIKKIT